jgi:hypothetical protein
LQPSHGFIPEDWMKSRGIVPLQCNQGTNAWTPPDADDFWPRLRYLVTSQEMRMPDVARFGRRTDGPEGRRRAVRERMDLAVSLYAVDQTRVTLLVDVSEKGCRLQGMGLPEIGQDVLLKVSNVELFGRIVWKDDMQRGVEFDQPLTGNELTDLRQILARQAGVESIEPRIIAPEGRRKSPF